MKKLILLCVGLTALGACKKNSEPVPSTTRVDLLTAKTWRLTTLTASVGSTPVPSSLIPTCYSDDLFKFNLDKTVVQDAGTVKCNSTDPQTQNGTWSFNNDQSKLTIAVPSSLLNGEAEVRELTTSTLRIYGTPTINGLVVNVDATFIPN